MHIQKSRAPLAVAAGTAALLTGALVHLTAQPLDALGAGLSVVEGQAPGGAQGAAGRGSLGGRGGGMATALFAATDANKDGAVSRDEFTGAFDKWFGEWDAANAGSLTAVQIGDGLTKATAAFMPGPPAGGGGQQDACGGRSANPRVPCQSDVDKMLAALPDKAMATPAKPRKVLVLAHASGFVHSSIPLAARMMEEMGKKTGAWTATTTYDPADVTTENLKQYDGIFLDNTTGCFLDDPNDAAATAARRAALLSFIRDGKGIAGIHAASDSYHGTSCGGGAGAGRAGGAAGAAGAGARGAAGAAGAGARGAAGAAGAGARGAAGAADAGARDAAGAAGAGARGAAGAAGAGARGAAGAAAGRAGGPGGALAMAMVAQGDTDGDQKLSRAEFSAITAAWYDKLDQDKTGRITQDVFMARFATLNPPPAAPAGRAGAAANAAPGKPGGDPLWPEFNKMIGGYFKFHWVDPQEITVKIDDPRSPLTAMFHGQEWVIHDETYTFNQESFSRDNVHVLTSVDYDKMTPEDKAKEPTPRTDHDYGLSWIRREGKGRLFYEAHGHHERNYAVKPFLEHVLAGVQYALGDLKADDTPSGKGTK